MSNTPITLAHFVDLSKAQESELLSLLKRLNSFSSSLKINLKDLEANILSILKSSLKELDEVYPSASKKIIKSLENILITIIAIQLPLLSTFIKASAVYLKKSIILSIMKNYCQK